MKRTTRFAAALGTAVLTFGASAPARAQEPLADPTIPPEVRLTAPRAETWMQTPSPPPPGTAPATMIPPPRWNGNALFVTGALTAAVSMALHGLAAHGVQKKCAVVENPGDLLPSRLRELGIGDVLDSTFLSNIDVLCSPQVGLALGARLLVPVFSAGSIAQVAVGGVFRGHQLGYDDAMNTGRRRSVALVAGVGGALMVAGAALWAGSRGSMLENRIGCDDIDCMVWYDFATFQGSMLLVTAGTGMLAQGLAYRQSRNRYQSWKNMGLRPLLSQREAGLVLEGRF